MKVSISDAEKTLAALHKAHSEGGRIRGEQRASARFVRRFVIEAVLSVDVGRDGLPERYRRRPYSRQTIEWLIEFLQKAHPSTGLGSVSEETIMRDIAAIKKKRSTLKSR
jgi:hypothetical protein